MTEHISPEEFRKKKKRKKFNNEIVRDHEGNKVADSKLEYQDGAHLEWLVRVGHIRDLSRQVNFPLKVAGVHICTYRADFVFRDAQGTSFIFESKGHVTDVYRIKRNLMRALYPEIRFIENWSEIK